MTQLLPWWAFSVIASLIWGLHYNLIARSSSAMSSDIWGALTIYFLPNIPLLLMLPFFWRKIWDNLLLIVHSPDPSVQWATGIISITSICASVSLYIAIHASKNPTMASLMEMMYPLYVALFAYLVFQQNQLSWSIGVGGTLIMLGAFIIIKFNG